MKLIAKHNVQVRGHIYAKGEAMEWDGPVTPRIIANFTAEDGSSPVATDAAQETPPQPPPDGVDEDALVKRTLDALKREGVMRQLDEMGVTYQANAKSTFLARLLLMSKGEIKCGE